MVVLGGLGLTTMSKATYSTWTSSTRVLFPSEKMIGYRSVKTCPLMRAILGLTYHVWWGGRLNLKRTQPAPRSQTSERTIMEPVLSYSHPPAPLWDVIASNNGGNNSILRAVRRSTKYASFDTTVYHSVDSRLINDIYDGLFDCASWPTPLLSADHNGLNVCFVASSLRTLYNAPPDALQRPE